jgi:hypothetical protein
MDTTINTKKMRVLVACECSGEVRNAFSALGHDAYSCDIKPSETLGNHIQGDVSNVLNQHWDLIIAHPPCTYLCVSGLHWNNKRPERAQKTMEALEFAKLFFNHPCEKIAIENPVSCISSKIRKPDQIIQPYDYGHDASKKTCLWLKGLPLLKATGPYVNPRLVKGKKRWSNQTDSGQNKLPPSDNRATLRSATYSGIAQAMANQWGGKVETEENDDNSRQQKKAKQSDD